MALKFRVVERKVLNGEEAGLVKNYARAKASGYTDLTKLCKLISARSTLSSADVKAVIDSLNWVMDLELNSGNIVQLGEFGNFRLSLNSAGTLDKEDFTVSKIRKARIVFTPGASLKLTAKETVFVPDDVKEVEQKCTETHIG